MRNLNLYLLGLLFSCAVLTARSQNCDHRYVDGELYFKVKSSFTGNLTLTSPQLLPLVALYQMDSCYRPFMGLGNDTLDRIYRLCFSDTAKTQKCIDTLSSLAFVEFVERAPIHYTSFVPNDGNPNQWSLAKINAQPAWSITKGSASVIIAIIDNGVLVTHEDLAANIWINTGEITGNGLDDDLNGYVDDRNGYDVADGDGNVNPPSGITSSDPFNHGTHCSGIAAGVTNNGKGIASIGFNCRIMPVKCNRNNAEGNVLTRVTDGIRYALRNGADVISMSFGSEGSSLTEQLLMNQCLAQGIVLVAAAGNDNVSTPFYPASYDGVISVGATDQNDAKASFSNFGSTVDVMAPGTSIYSTVASSNTAYSFFGGTSMACPLVAGLAGLVKTVAPAFTPAQVTAQIKNNTDNISSLNPGFNGQLGTGRINAFKTLQQFGNISGVNEETLNGVRVYPNPMANELIVETGADNEPVQVELANINGQVIYQQTLTSGLSSIFATGWPVGIYFLKLTNGNNSKVVRLVKGE